MEHITILKPTYLLGEHALYLLDGVEKVVDGYYMVGVPKIRPSVSSGQKTVSHNLKSPTHYSIGDSRSLSLTEWEPGWKKKILK